ncbi:VacJ family lipoprotein [Pseudomonas sp. CAH-1]|uniref:MlaA family lipoprotein n=1 Tax=unclassified Pseudomonas TaxID=196821 RepID=UPI001306E3D4|nr:MULTISPECIES: VacJ family lipoprotein [Pseudomonas]MRT63116.1 VacJ family lipoprotein [Pseudomonas sp. CAH-1]NOY01624.1 VacJ family lipoprotein [Gammaproteobacteria bacterium]MCK2113716.1 VacJ family lipoprotein [Pseudomonas juntendi]MCK2118577.1 VacJ family lipoprotein [Pseudomonas juntendi]MCO7057621.1 VacJ family lipoprotein [Pseudomonas juntendi]
MVNKLLFATALLAAGHTLAAETAPRASVVEADPQVVGTAPLVPESDGFLDPLRELKFNPGLDQREFERSTLEALNVYDPLESVNRRIYHFNYRLDQWVLLPLVNGYQYVTPSFVRTGVSNFFNNLGDVPNLFNSVLQLKAKRSAEITARLMFNTIIGVGGLWDPATSMGLPRQSEDFGQTLGFYGVPEGPYLMLPLLGPSNLRDTTGLAVDYAGEQSINYLNVADASKDHPEIFALRVVDKRYNTKFRYGQLNSPFEYEKVRYVYTQSRKLQIAE